MKVRLVVTGLLTLLLLPGALLAGSGIHQKTGDCGCGVVQKPLIAQKGHAQKGHVPVAQKAPCKSCGPTQKAWGWGSLFGHAQKPGCGCGVAQKGIVQKGCVQKGCIQKGVTQKGIVQKEVVQKGIVQKGAVQKGPVQKSKGWGTAIPQKGLLQHGFWNFGSAQKCATQKGGCEQKHVVQKAPVQKSCPPPVISQKGCEQKGIAQKGCAQKSCGGCGKGGCAFCGLEIIPRALHGIGDFLGHTLACSSVRSKSDCGAVEMIDDGYDFSAPAPPNPFADEHLPPPIMMDSDAESDTDSDADDNGDSGRETIPRPMLRPASREDAVEAPTPAAPLPPVLPHTAYYPSRRTIAAPVVRATPATSSRQVNADRSAEPATFQVAEGLTPQRLQPKTTLQASPITRVSNEVTSERRDVPRNPLRAQ